MQKDKKVMRKLLKGIGLIGFLTLNLLSGIVFAIPMAVLILLLTT